MAPKFRIKVFGMSVNGNFSEIKINTNVNYGDLSRSYTDWYIGVSSISSGIESRDEYL